jgi:ABC-2 type transport system permease protein
MHSLWAMVAKSARDQRRSLVWWVVALTALVWVEAALWPTIEDMPDFQQFLKQYPEGLRKLFDIEAMTTGQGFMNAELFSFMLPILFIVFAIGKAVRSTAGEEEAGALDVVLVAPVSRATIAIAKAIGVAVGVVVLGAALAVALVTASLVFDLEIAVAGAVTGSLVMVALGVEFGLLAVAVGVGTGRRALAMAVAGGAAVGAYVLYVAAQFVDGLQAASDWSPMGQALSEGPLGAGIRGSHAAMAVTAVAVLVVALPVFAHRDIRAHG